MARHIERFAGIAAALVGTVLLVFALYGPTSHSSSTESRSDGSTVTINSTSSIVESEGLSVVLILFLAILAVALFGVAFGAHSHAVSGSTEASMLLWVSTFVLAFGALLSMFSIGLYVAPAVLLALIACIAGSNRTPHPQPQDPSHA